MVEEINNQAAEIHAANAQKGFWDEPRPIGTLLMLIVSELAEALEADRHKKHADLNQFEEQWDETLDMQEAFKTHIKDTFEDEIADAYIRILDLAGGLNINLGKHVAYKLAYNKTRGHKHGKSY